MVPLVFGSMREDSFLNLYNSSRDHVLINREEDFVAGLNHDPDKLKEVNTLVGFKVSSCYDFIVFLFKQNPYRLNQ